MTRQELWTAALIAAVMVFLYAVVGRQDRQAAAHPSPRDLAGEQAVTFEYLAGTFGFSICYKERGYSFIAEGLSQMEVADTRAHEARHREQYTRFKSCAAFEDWYRIPLGKLRIEAEAAHAGWCAQLALGADTVSSRRLYVERIADYVHRPRQHVDRALAEFGPCP